MVVPARNASTRIRRGSSGVVLEPKALSEDGSAWEVLLRGEKSVAWPRLGKGIVSHLYDMWSKRRLEVGEKRLLNVV